MLPLRTNAPGESRLDGRAAAPVVKSAFSFDSWLERRCIHAHSRDVFRYDLRKTDLA
jgi:hypothetical protein